MEKIQDLKNKYITLDKFLFVWKEPKLHNKAFFNRTTLKAGVVITSILSLILGTGLVLHSIEDYSFLFFLSYFLPNLVVMAGSVLVLLSLEHLDQGKAYSGYVVSAIAVLLQAALGALALIFTFFYSPKYFFQKLFINVFILGLVLVITGYSAWIDYCYIKHLNLGNRELVEYGREEGLISKELQAGVPTSNVSNVNIQENKKDPEIGIQHSFE